MKSRRGPHVPVGQHAPKVGARGPAAGTCPSCPAPAAPALPGGASSGCFKTGCCQVVVWWGAVGGGAGLFQRAPRLDSSHPGDPTSRVRVFLLPTMQDLKEEIDIRLSRVQDIKYEPRLLAEDDSRLLQLETQGTLFHCCSARGPQKHRPGLGLPQQVVPWGQVASLAPLVGCPLETSRLASSREPVSLHFARFCFPPPLPWLAELSVCVFPLPGCYNYLYRMKALDAIRTSGKGAQGGSERAGVARGCVGRKRAGVLASSLAARLTLLAREERSPAWGSSRRVSPAHPWGAVGGGRRHGDQTHLSVPFSCLSWTVLLSRNPVSCGGAVPEVFNREELLCLPAGTAEFQHLLQRHPQSLDRHLAGWVRECSLRHWGKRWCPAQGTFPLLRPTATLRSHCHLGYVFDALFRLCPGLWKTGVSEVPGRSERAGERVSVTAGGAAGERGWLPGPQQLFVEV